jgi:hypothetical protein
MCLGNLCRPDLVCIVQAAGYVLYTSYTSQKHECTCTTAHLLVQPPHTLKTVDSFCPGLRLSKPVSKSLRFLSRPFSCKLQAHFGVASCARSCSRLTKRLKRGTNIHKMIRSDNPGTQPPTRMQLAAYLLIRQRSSKPVLAGSIQFHIWHDNWLLP